jgi:hypothetical protein
MNGCNSTRATRSGVCKHRSPKPRDELLEWRWLMTASIVYDWLAIYGTTNNEVISVAPGGPGNLYVLVNNGSWGSFLATAFKLIYMNAAGGNVTITCTAGPHRHFARK